MQIEQTLTPDSKDIDFLRKMIDAENPYNESIHPIAFFVRNHDGQIIAGCNCFVIFGTIYTDQLWVHTLYRKQGLAKRLMYQVHQYGKELKCTMATVATMSFQKSIGFYEKLGYVADFVRDGYGHEASAIFLKKDLMQ